MAVVETAEAGFNRNGRFHSGRVAVSPDGAHVYYSTSQGFVAFSRNVVTGEVTLVQDVPGVSGCASVGEMAISPDGEHLYINCCCNNLSLLDPVVVAYDRDPASGELTVLQMLDSADGLSGAAASGVAVSPDGRHVYAGQSVLARDVSTGELTVSGPPSGISFKSLAVSPDGLNVYARFGLFTVHSLSRNVTTGALTLVQSFEIEHTGSEDELDDLAVSPDGGQVYTVAGRGSPGMRVFRRSTSTGELTEVQVVRSKSQPRAVGGAGIAIDPGGNAAYLVAGASQLTLGRDPATGKVTFGDSVVVPFTFRMARVAVSPDGNHLYAGLDGAQLRVYAKQPSPCPAAQLDGCRRPAEPGKGTLQIRDKESDAGDLIRWSWAKGGATLESAFGDPLVDTEYLVCGYDGTQRLVTSLIARSADSTLCGPPCWKAKASGFSYKDRFRTLDGLHTIRLKPGDEGNAKIKVKAVGLNVDPPPLPLYLPMTLQLQASNGECWEATFFEAGASRNEDGFFKGKPGSPSRAFLGGSKGALLE